MRLESITNALSFRADRRRNFGNAEYENLTEIWDGLERYTEWVLTSRTQNALLANFNAFARDFVGGGTLGVGCRRLTGALYAFLLDEFRIHWKEDLTAESDLGLILQEALGISPHLDITNIDKTHYSHAAIVEEETEYMENLRIMQALLAESLENHPLLKIHFEYWENLFFGSFVRHTDIPDVGQVGWGDIEFGGIFGIFEIRNGLYIIHNDGFIAVIAENMEINDRVVAAETWRLLLMDGFYVVPYGDNFIITRREG
jgi:hypothetical protein